MQENGQPTYRYILIATVDDEGGNVYRLIDLDLGEYVPLLVVEKDWRHYRFDNPKGTYQSLLQARDTLQPYAHVPVVQRTIESIEEDIRSFEDFALGLIA